MPYTDLTIENFRGIKKLTINDLKRVNLLVGRNNCGKTSVLEAIFLISGMANPRLPVNIHLFRDLILNNDNDFSFMFKDLDFNIPITISANIDNKRRKLTIQPHYADYQQKGANTQKQAVSQTQNISESTAFVRLAEGIDLKFQSDLNHQFSANISLKENEVNMERTYQEKLRCAFLNPKTVMDKIDQRIEALVKEKQLDSVISVLQNIEPTVTDIRMGTGGMIYIDIGRPKLFPLNIMGDGMRRILAMITAVSDLKNGVLLVDEIENGLDYASLAVSWKALLAACRKYNVQLIATTHSYECIEAFSKTYIQIEPDGDDIRLYRIDKDEDTHQAFALTSPMLQAGIEKEFEVR
jgi:AAA15 family ATPase/GTPase